MVADVTEHQFATLIDAVINHVCDISIASQIMTPGRLLLIDMVPYRQGDISLVVRKGDARIQKRTDLCGLKLSVVHGSIWVAYVGGTGDYKGSGLDDECKTANLANVDIREYATDQLAQEALAAGDADAYVGDTRLAYRQPSVYSLSVLLETIRDGIGVAKDHPALRDAIDRAFRKMVADGSYLKLLKKYGISASAIPSR